MDGSTARRARKIESNRKMCKHFIYFGIFSFCRITRCWILIHTHTHRYIQIDTNHLWVKLHCEFRTFQGKMSIKLHHNMESRRRRRATKMEKWEREKSRIDRLWNENDVDILNVEKCSQKHFTMSCTHAAALTYLAETCVRGKKNAQSILI